MAKKIMLGDNIRRLKKSEYEIAKNFFIKNYGVNYTLNNKLHFDWLFDGYKNDSDDEYTAFAAFSKHGHIIGFYAWIPAEFYFFQKKIKTNFQMNMMVDESFRKFGYGALLLSRVEENGADLGVTLNVGEQGRRLIEPLGWQVNNLNRYIFILNAKHVSEISGIPVNFISENTLSSSVSLKSFKVTKISRADESFTKLADDLSCKYPITLVRDANYINWRWFSHPSLTYHLFSIANDEVLMGFFVLRVEQYKNYKIGRILDFLCHDNAESSLLYKTVLVGIDLKLDFIDYFTFGNFHRESLLSVGYVVADEALNAIPMVFNPPDSRPAVNFTYKFFKNSEYKNDICQLNDWYINKADADGDRAN